MSLTRRAAVIFGAPRSGTTSLWRYIRSHPDIAPSRIKELDFFFKSQGDLLYDDFFPSTGSVTLEASPVYFREHGLVVPRLHHGLPKARLICVLREPAARLSASFRGERDWNGRVAQGVSFADYATIVANDEDPAPIFPADITTARYVRDGSKVGIYADILAHYLEHFTAEQILVLFLDELTRSPDVAIDKVCRHIGVDADALPKIDFRPENQGVNIRNVGLFRALRRVNNAVEPLLNQMPRVRQLLKTAHQQLNGAPMDRYAAEEEAGKAILRDWYATHNRRLHELLRHHYPTIEMPEWVTGQGLG